MDGAGVDIQLICQSAAMDADQLPTDKALEVMRRANDIMAERIAGYPDRFLGVIAISLKNIEGSVNEIQRMANRGFRAVLMVPYRYPRPGADRFRI